MVHAGEAPLIMAAWMGALVRAHALLVLDGQYGNQYVPARRAPNMAAGYQIVFPENIASVSPALKP